MKDGLIRNVHISSGETDNRRNAADKEEAVRRIHEVGAIGIIRVDSGPGRGYAVQVFV